MTALVRVSVFLFVCLSAARSVAVSAAPPPGRPAIDGHKALASVNGAPVTVDEFEEAFAQRHAQARETGKLVQKQNPADLLDRLINSRLIVQEGRNMGLDQSPEAKSALDAIRLGVLRGLVYERAPAPTKPDPALVDRLYQKRVGEYTVRSVLVTSEADAKALSGAVKAGGDFDALVKDLVAGGKAEAHAEDEKLKAAEALPEVGAALSVMKPGELSPPLRVGRGYALMRLREVAVPENPDARRQAAEDALAQQKTTAREEYRESLRAKYTVVDEKLLAALDYDAAGAGADKFVADRRVVATVKGAAGITVGDLTRELQKKFFHGLAEAASQKKVNRQKVEILDRLRLERAILLEAKRLDLAKTPQFEDTFRDEEEGMLFGAFVQKVIDPEIKLGDPELKKYMAEHVADFTASETMTIEQLAFAKREDAEATLTRLRQGADPAWIRANAAGQVDRAARPDMLGLGPDPIPVPELPEGVRKAVTGASAGEFRLYAPPEGPFSVLLIRDVVPAHPQPFDVVKAAISRALLAEKREAAIGEWAAKLRAASDVKVFATREQLDQILHSAFGGGQ